jgi:hypothetical protein
MSHQENDLCNKVNSLNIKKRKTSSRQKLNNQLRPIKSFPTYSEIINRKYDNFITEFLN